MSSSVDPAAAHLPSDEASELAARLATLDPRVMTPEVVQQLMTMAIRAYSDLVERGIEVSPLVPGSAVSATDAVRAASGILKALDLETFELALWQMFGGSPTRSDQPRAGGPR